SSTLAQRFDTAMPSSQPDGMPIVISFSSPEPSPEPDPSSSPDAQAARETARARVPPAAARRRVWRPRVMRMSFLTGPARRRRRTGRSGSAGGLERLRDGGTVGESRGDAVEVDREKHDREAGLE